MLTNLWVSYLLLKQQNLKSMRDSQRLDLLALLRNVFMD